jgi:Penicillin tolerance protein
VLKCDGDFSAHGVSQQVRKEAEARKVSVFDATCPLVTKVHNEISVFLKGIRKPFLLAMQDIQKLKGRCVNTKTRT